MVYHVTDQPVATIKLTFPYTKDPFDHEWWAPVDVTEPEVWYYLCFSNEQLWEMLPIFLNWDRFDSVEVIYNDKLHFCRSSTGV